MKTTLCLTCWYGLVKEVDCEDDNCKVRHFTMKCLLGNDYVSVITMCNRYKKKDTKVTYHDPDYKEYASSLTKEECNSTTKDSDKGSDRIGWYKLYRDELG